ncbi:MAG TPA: ribose-phosphate pyrophosphokinase [Candidatus Bathyarchaeia archaeon]|nr:ribose-phosphate pyrophosphokinase [Candidatus Bathyarchaeia archaeon]
MDKIQLISGRSHPELAQSIAKILKIGLTSVEIKDFADGEIYFRIGKKVRNDDVFFIQSVSPPVNDHLMELLIGVDALKRASAGRINLVCPFLAYTRQDRKAVSREPITAKLVADLITKAGADRLVTVDLHADQIQGFYDIPVDHLVGYPLFARYLLENKIDKMVIISPDVGGLRRGRGMAKLLNLPLAMIDKRRPVHNQAQVLNVIGDVEGKTAILIDDIIDTAGTVVEIARALKEKGAREVIICTTHGLLSGDACRRLRGSAASKILLLDTLPLAKEKKIDKIEIISLAPLLAEVIRRIHLGKSLGALFTWEKKEVVL